MALPNLTRVDCKAGEPTEVGGMRCIRIGDGLMFEQLVGLDDEEHILRWKVVSHPETVNPFKDASFVNYITTIRLHPVTIGDMTYLSWTGTAFTEHAFAGALQSKLERWYQDGILSLQAYLAQQQLAPPVVPVTQPLGSTIPQLQTGFGPGLFANGFPSAGRMTAGAAAATHSGSRTPIGTSQAPFSAAVQPPPVPLPTWGQPPHAAPQSYAPSTYTPPMPVPSISQPVHIAAHPAQQQHAYQPPLPAAFAAAFQAPTSAAVPPLAAFSAAPVTAGLPFLPTGAPFTSQAAFAAMPQGQGSSLQAASMSRGPSSQLGSQLGSMPQGQGPPQGGFQTQAAFLAESLKQTRLSQFRMQQQQQQPPPASKVHNVPSFSDGLQALYDQADEAQAARCGRRNDPATPASPLASSKSVLDPVAHSATPQGCAAPSEQGSPRGLPPGGFGSLTLLTETEQTALRAALHTEAQQQGAMLPPQAEGPKNAYANAFVSAPPRAVPANVPSPWAATAIDRMQLNAPQMGLPRSQQSIPEGPGPRDSEDYGSNTTMSWTGASSSRPSSQALSGFKSSQDSGGSKSSSGGSKSSQDSGGSDADPPLDSRNTSLDSDKSTTEDDNSQAIQRRNSFEFDRPSKVLGRKSFEGATHPHPAPNHPKSRRTGGDSETWHSNGPTDDSAEDLAKGGTTQSEVATQGLSRFSPFAASQSSSQSQSEKSSQASQRLVGLSQLSPFAAAM